jgi:hypothetical protein
MAVTGTWYSAVGSRLQLKEKGSELYGTFDSTESATGKSFSLHGSVDPNTSLKNRALSFSVSWIDKSTPPKSKHRSVTSYTGQYHNDKGVETIQVVFLLVNGTAPANAYASVFVGSDIFTRTKP